MRVKQNDCERFRWKVSCVFKFPLAPYLVNTRISTNVKTTICDNRIIEYHPQGPRVQIVPQK